MCVLTGQITARHEGQVSLLAKKNGHTSVSSSTYNDDSDSEFKSIKVPPKNRKQEENLSSENNSKNKSNESNQSSDKNKNSEGNDKSNNEDSEKRVLDIRDDPPPGTVYPLPQNRVRKEIPEGGGVDGSVGSIMCCSDKIAKWNAIGQ